MIEPLVPYVSLCLKNYYRNIRELTLVVIIDLLKEDYLRARSAIVYHLLSLLNDKFERTVAIVKSYFTKAMDQNKRKLVSCFNFQKIFFLTNVLECGGDSHQMHVSIQQI